MKEIANNNASAIFENFLNEIVNVVNYIRGRAQKHKMSTKLCEGMEASYKRLLLYSEVRWLSRGRVLSKVFELKKKLGTFFLVEKDQRATNFSNSFWSAKLSYMACIFEHLNKLNISLQGKNNDVFKSTGKVNALKRNYFFGKKESSQKIFLIFLF